jgi:hypothetical protein
MHSTTSADAAADAAGMESLRRLEPILPDWFVMYSLHKRALVAFFQGDCPPPGLIVEAGRPEELLRRTEQAKRALWQPPAVLAGSPPGEGAGG